jgi:disulfide bond formation protein DsbB
MIQLAEKLIYDLKHYPNSNEFRDHYLSHPDYPSLYAVTDTLDFFGIENLAVRVTQEQFGELPARFLSLYTTVKGDQFIYITQKAGDNIDFTDEDNKQHRVTKNQFLTNWKEIVVAVEENKNVAGPSTDRTPYQWLFIPAIVILLLFVNHYVFGFSPVSLLYAVLSLAGLGLSILLIQEGLGISNEITDKICGASPVDEGGCKSVLHSPAAVLYKNFTLSDVCFTFFSALTLLAVFPVAGSLYFIMIGFFSFPVISFSVYYQKAVAKKWCALCLGIAAVLAISGIITFIQHTTFFIRPVIYSSLYFTAVFALTISTWVVLKPFVTGYFELKNSDRENKRFKRNITTFTALLEKTKEIDTASLDRLQKIELGEKNAVAELSLFLSPSCGHCHTAFKDALSVFEQHKDLLKLAIYFNINIDNHQNEYRSVAEIILEHYLYNGNALELLKDWHINTPSIEAFREKYSIPVSGETREILRSHFNWCNANDFNYSPVKLFNKKLMPAAYSINDLRFIIREFKN